MYAPPGVERLLWEVGHNLLETKEGMTWCAELLTICLPISPSLGWDEVMSQGPLVLMSRPRHVEDSDVCVTYGAREVPSHLRLSHMLARGCSVAHCLSGPCFPSCFLS